MQIDGLSAFLYKDIQQKQGSSQNSSLCGPDFFQSFREMALRTDVVVRGNELSAFGMSDRKMVNDWKLLGKEAEGETIEDIFKKINRIDEILKEKFSR